MGKIVDVVYREGGAKIQFGSFGQAFKWLATQHDTALVGLDTEKRKLTVSTDTVGVQLDRSHCGGAWRLIDTDTNEWLVSACDDAFVFYEDYLRYQSSTPLQAEFHTCIEYLGFNTVFVSRVSLTDDYDTVAPEWIKTYGKDELEILADEALKDPQMLDDTTLMNFLAVEFANIQRYQYTNENMQLLWQNKAKYVTKSYPDTALRAALSELVPAVIALQNPAKYSEAQVIEWLLDNPETVKVVRTSSEGWQASYRIGAPCGFLESDVHKERVDSIQDIMNIVKMHDEGTLA